MHSQVTTLTPTLAKQFLSNNIEQNRPVRKHVVRKYATQMKKGDWPLTAEAIMFDVNGKLVNGQHRCHAVIEAGVPVKVYVTYGVEPSTYAYLDDGAKRSVADKLQIDRKVAEVVRLCANLTMHEFSPADLHDVYDIVGAVTEELQAFAPSNTRHFAAASMKFAAVTRILMGEDRDYVYSTYRSLCLGNVDELPNIGKSLIKQHLRGQLSATKSGYGLLQHGWVVFNKKNANKEVLRISQPEAVTEEIRKFYAKKLGIK